MSIPDPARGGRIKCLVWDLDETLWQGTLLEGGGMALAPGVAAAIRALDDRGILQSVASRNDHDTAWARLAALGVADYFLHPQIGWSSKAGSIETIAARLGIGLDTIALIDDQAIERDEIAWFLPRVTTIDAATLPTLLDDPRLIPRFVTDDARRRRAMYVADDARRDAESRFDGTRGAFLATLGMRMTIRRAGLADLERAGELTVRTNQLNTTGRTYAHDELAAMIDSSGHLILVAELDDRYGSSGTIGLAMVDLAPGCWTIRLLIMSCRVLSRGVGTVMLAHLVRRARAGGVALRAAFVPTDRNRQMLVTFKFAGFRTLREDAGEVLLGHDFARLPPLPGYVEVRTDPDAVSAV